MDRQLQLRRGSTTLDLANTPYLLEAGSWNSLGGMLSFSVVVQATTLTELDRHVSAIRRLLTAAKLNTQEYISDPVCVYTKVCDDLTVTAELGATWMRKTVTAGSVSFGDPSIRADKHYTTQIGVTLEVDPVWRRDKPISILTGTANYQARSDGGVTGITDALRARRLTWTASSGLTLRVRWIYSDNNVTFFSAEAGTYDVEAIYQASNNKFYMSDTSGNSLASFSISATAGDELDVVFKWDPVTEAMRIWLNGTLIATMNDCVITFGTLPDTYTVFVPTTSQSLLSCQVWPSALTDAQCSGLYDWGRPEPELPFLIAPADTKNTNAFGKLYNIPGEAQGLMRLMFLSSGAQDYDQVRVGLSPLKIQTTHLWECESGTLGTATADNTNSDASAGHQARFTPTDTSYATRVTVTLCADPDDVPGMIGDYRLYLAGYDGAASIDVNVIKWRLVVAGEAEDYSDEYSFAAVATRSLLDLGPLSIPSGAWPEESIKATTDVHGGAYITLEIQAKNTTGNGGGTLDLDALYMFPIEREGIWTGDLDVSSVKAVVDHASSPWAAVAISDEHSLEFSKWAAWVGDQLTIAPNFGDAGGLVYYAYRNGVEQAYPNDTISLYAFMLPRWEI